MSKFTDQCPVQSSIMGMHITHQALHVIEWAYVFYPHQNDPRNPWYPIGKRAKKVMCICGETFNLPEQSPSQAKQGEKT
jgi:hypothetical protein